MAGTDITRTGSCLCGKVQYRLFGEPALKVLCHCVSCQKSCGVVFQSNVFYLKDVRRPARMPDGTMANTSRTPLTVMQKVDISDPEGVISNYDDSSCDSGGVVRRDFCKSCGSFLRTTNLTNPDIQQFVIIPMGVIDGEKESLKPLNEFYVKRRTDWIPRIPGSNEYQGME